MAEDDDVNLKQHRLTNALGALYFIKKKKKKILSASKCCIPFLVSLYWLLRLMLCAHLALIVYLTVGPNPICCVHTLMYVTSLASNYSYSLKRILASMITFHVSGKMKTNECWKIRLSQWTSQAKTISIYTLWRVSLFTCLHINPSQCIITCFCSLVYMLTLHSAQ